MASRKSAGTGGRFDGKVVIVTGAASGIGEATAHRFSSEGASVVLAELSAQHAGRVTARKAMPCPRS